MIAVLILTMTTKDDTNQTAALSAVLSPALTRVLTTRTAALTAGHELGSSPTACSAAADYNDEDDDVLTPGCADFCADCCSV